MVMWRENELFVKEYVLLCDSIVRFNRQRWQHHRWLDNHWPFFFRISLLRADPTGCSHDQQIRDTWTLSFYEACPEKKDTKVLNMHIIF